MKKIAASEFQRFFSRTARRLKPGQSILVTKRGKILGTFTKVPEGKPRTFRCPDFMAELRSEGFDKRIGQKAIDGICTVVLSGSGVSANPAS